jgi:ATP-dependent helicase/nuclease subunit A
VVTNNFAQTIATRQRVRRGSRALGPLIEKRRAVIVRDRTEALLHIAIAVPQTTAAKSWNAGCSTMTI